MSTESIQELINAEVAKRLAEASADDSKRYAAEHDGMPYVVVRAYSAGVFAGYLLSISGNVVRLRNSRFCRTWKPVSVGDVTELATVGVGGPSDGVRQAVPERVIVDSYELIYATEAARLSIEGA